MTAPVAAAPAVTTRAARGGPEGRVAGDPSLPLTRSQRIANLAIFAALMLVAGALVVQVFLNATALWPIDAYNYWFAWHGPMYREGARLFLNGYVYSPAFTLPLWPLAQFPWPDFALVWSALAFATYAWLLKPLPLVPFRIPLLVACLLPISAGNIEWFLALLLVAGGPAGWAVAALTKITPALVGPIWYAARREWRALAVAVVVPGVIALASFVIAPSAWLQWIGVLLDSVRLSATGGGVVPPLFVRVPVATLMTIWAARSGRAWILPIAMTVAQPDPTWTTAGLLAAIPRLSGPAWRDDRVVTPLRRAGPVLLAGASVVAFVLIVERFPTVDFRMVRWP